MTYVPPTLLHPQAQKRHYFQFGFHHSLADKTDFILRISPYLSKELTIECMERVSRIVKGLRTVFSLHKVLVLSNVLKEY